MYLPKYVRDHPYITSDYVSKGIGWEGSENWQFLLTFRAICANVWLGWSEKVPKPADVMQGWSLTTQIVRTCTQHILNFQDSQPVPYCLRGRCIISSAICLHAIMQTYKHTQSRSTDPFTGSVEIKILKTFEEKRHSQKRSK